MGSLRPQLPTLRLENLSLRQTLPWLMQGWVLFPARPFDVSEEERMAEIVSFFKKRADEGDELEELIHEAFLKRQDLMWKRPIMDEEITRIDLWLLQHKPPLDILVAIWSRLSFCEWIAYGDANPEQKHRMLLNLRECYREFQKLPERWQEALWSIGYGRWHAELMEQEEEEARANGAA
jgi:hypothetical protein